VIPHECPARLVEQLVNPYALKHPGQTVPGGLCCHALEERSVIGVNMTRAAIFQAREENRVVALGKGGPKGLYPMP
jgi:hypothetical protein